MDRAERSAKAIETLVEEFRHQRSIIVETHNNIKKLQHAEQESASEEWHVGPLLDADTQQTDYPSLNGHSVPPTARIPLPTNIGAAHSKDENKARWRSAGQYYTDQQQLLSPEQSPERTVNGDLAVNLTGTHITNLQEKAPNTLSSTMLLQMAPYRPNIGQNSLQSTRRLSGSRVAYAAHAEIEMEEVNKIVILLLDKWVVTGSAPVSKILGDGINKDDELNR